MKWVLALLLVFLVVSAQEKDNDIDLSFGNCPIEGACPSSQCCTDYSCDNERLGNGKSVKCCSKEELLNEQQMSQESRICSPCLKCGKNCPRKISILSNGDASTWEDKLGSYQLIRYDEAENAVYEHTSNSGNFLFKPTDNREMWMVGNEVGKNFGWIGHSNCSKQCPTSCEARNWKYWNGVTGGEGDWDKDEYLRIDVPPRKVALTIDGIPRSEYTFKMIEQGEKKLSIDCIARQATPTPVFEWKLGGSLIEDDETISERVESTSDSENLADYIETLTFHPKYDHDEKLLTCTVIHQAYSNNQRQDKQNVAQTLLKIHYPPVKKQEPLEQVVTWGEENKVQIQFNANPKPSHGYWTINGTRVSIGTTSKDRKYISSPLLGTEDLINGMWIVELTIRELTLYDSMKPHYLTVQNEEGLITYDFKLAIEQSTPPTLLPPSDWPLESLEDNTWNECYKYETTYSSDDMAYNIGIESSAEECQRHCQNITGCNHFSYEKEPKRCRLKKTSDEDDVQYSRNTIAGPKYCDHGSIVVILVVIIICVVAFLLVFCCCCFLETSGEDPERYVVFKNDNLNVSRQMLPKVLENSASLVFIVSMVEEWRDKLLCIENRKNKSVIQCDETGVTIELKGIDKAEEANGI